jgi:hypothetical protein
MPCGHVQIQIESMKMLDEYFSLAIDIRQRGVLWPMRGELRICFSRIPDLTLYKQQMLPTSLTRFVISQMLPIVQTVVVYNEHHAPTPEKL